MALQTIHRFYVYILYRDLERMQPFYVGKGCAERYKRHSYDAFYAWKKGSNRHKNAIVKQCVEKFGYVPHDFYARDLTESAALALEVALIAVWGREAHGGPLTNTTDGGEGVSGLVHSAEARLAIATKNTGQKRTLEQRAKMSAWQIGRIMSPEARQKNREARTGSKWSEETRAIHAALRAARGPTKLSSEVIAKIKAANTGKKRTPEARAKMSAAAKARTDNRGRGIPKSDETKEKLRIAQTGRKHTPETRAKMAQRRASDETRAKMSESHKARWAELKAGADLG